MLKDITIEDYESELRKLTLFNEKLETYNRIVSSFDENQQLNKDYIIKVIFGEEFYLNFKNK